MESPASSVKNTEKTGNAYRDPSMNSRASFNIPEHGLLTKKNSLMLIAIKNAAVRRRRICLLSVYMLMLNFG